MLGLAIYLVSTYSWEANSKQEEEAENQFNQMRANLARKQNQGDNSVNEALLDRDKSSVINGSNTLFDLTAIAPNQTNVHF